MPRRHPLGLQENDPGADISGSVTRVVMAVDRWRRKNRLHTVPVSVVLELARAEGWTPPESDGKVPGPADGPADGKQPETGQGSGPTRVDPRPAPFLPRGMGRPLPAAVGRPSPADGQADAEQIRRRDFASPRPAVAGGEAPTQPERPQQ
jgi:hypothetical protein